MNIIDTSEVGSERITYSISFICSEGENAYSGYLDEEFVSFRSFPSYKLNIYDLGLILSMLLSIHQLHVPQKQIQTKILVH